MLEPIKLLPVIEKTINRYLSFDTEKAAELESLEGKCIQINLSKPEVSAYCLPMEGALQIESEWSQPADVVINTTLSGLLKLSRSDNPAAAISAGEVEIEGDLRVAQQFADTLAGIDFDWEQQLSNFSGDFIANRIGMFVREGSKWLQQTGTNLRTDTAEYLTEEADILPTKVEIEDFASKVENLRDAVDRLEARINLIDARDKT